MIDFALARARRGAGLVVVVEGHEGLGKSALLSEAESRATAFGFATLCAQAAEFERELPFGVVHSLFEPVLAAVGPAERAQLESGAAALATPLFAPAGPWPRGGPSAESELLRGLRALTANLAAAAPLLIVVDDAHWADAPSLRFLTDLGAALAGQRVALLVACLPQEARARTPWLGELVAAAGDRVVPLLPLSEAAVKRFVEERHPGARGDLWKVLAHASGGNPMLLDALLRGLAARGIVTADRARGFVPDAVLRSTLARLARLPSGSLDLARAAAALQDDARLRVAACVAGLGLDQASEAAAALTRAHIVHDADPLAFVYPVVRDAVYAGMAAAERALLHGRAARRLAADSGLAADHVAAHFERGRPEGDPWAVEALRGAARRCLAAGATATAARYLRRALDEPPSSSLRPILLAELGRAELAGGVVSGVERLETAVELLPECSARAELLAELGERLYLIGRPVAAADAFERGLDQVGRSGAGGEALEVGWLTAARLDPARCTLAVQRLRSVRERAPFDEPATERLVLANRARELVLAGEQRDTAIDLAHHALAGGDLLTGEPSNPLAWLLAVEVLAWSDRLDEHERITRVAIADARRRGSVIAHALAGDARSHGHHLAGRLADAEADLRDAIAVYESHSPDLLRRAKARLASILIDQDQLHAAESALVAVADDPSEAPTLAQGLLLEVRSRLRLVQGRAREALDDALAAGRAMEAMLVRNPAICAWRSRAADVLLKLGDDARARDLAAEEVALARGFGSPRAIGVALRSAGLIEGRDLGLELLRESVAVLERSPAALEQARSSAELGAALRRRRSPRQARQPLRDALDRASRLGAGALAQRALDELVASGARPRRRELSGVGSLTASERRVAQMAATGMTNREIAGLLFVTTKAVQWHLRNVYLKLGTSERAELAEALADGDGTHDRVD